MISRAHLTVLLLLVASTSVNGFAIGTSETLRFDVRGDVSYYKTQVPTCLYAEKESDTEGSSDEEVVSAGDAGESADILSSPAFLKRKLEVLKKEIASVDEEVEKTSKLVEEGREEWEPQLEHLRREHKNIQDRLSTQSKEGDAIATQAVVREMLELLDNFDRAFGAVTPETDEEKAIEAEYKDGYQTILDTFASLGVEEIETIGKEFDYGVHQAVFQMPSEEYEEGVVCQELQKGYKIGDTLVRAAMVAVAA